MALTEGAVTVAVVGAVVQEGVGDATGVTCRTGGSLTPSVAPLSQGCTAIGHKAAPTTPALARSELGAKDSAGTYPGAMLGVPGKPGEERDRPGEMQSPSTALPAPQQGPLCAPDTGIYPRDSAGYSCRGRGFATGWRGQNNEEPPRQTRPCCCLQPSSPVSRLGESMAARSPFLLCCLPREAALSPFVPLLGEGTQPQGPQQDCAHGSAPEGQRHPGTHRQPSQQAMSSVRM